MAATAEPMTVQSESELTKVQQQRFDRYQALGRNSKSRADKQKFDSRSKSLQSRSLSRRRKLDQLSQFDQFCEIVSDHRSNVLNPSNFLDFLASLISVYCGTSLSVSITKYTSNKHSSGDPLQVIGIDHLIPYLAPRDQICVKLSSKLKAIVEPHDEKHDEKHDEDSKQSMNISPIRVSYCFGALPDQRLFTDGKFVPYIMNESFEWTILHGASVYPPRIKPERATAFVKVTCAGIISDGTGIAYCLFGTGDGLFYNPYNANDVLIPQKAKRLLSGRICGIFRQNDYLFVLQGGPSLHSVTLSTKGDVAVTQVFASSKPYSVFSFFDSFVGGYYDREGDRLFLGGRNASVIVFHNHGKKDDGFDSNLRKWRSSECDIEKGNIMYFDVDQKCVVYIGTKFVWKLMVDGQKGVPFVRKSELRHHLKGIGFDCNHFLYIYHQKTLVVMKRLQASAERPYLLKIYAEKSLRFE